VDQAAEPEAAGSHWQDTGRVFATATGTPLGASRERSLPATSEIDRYFFNTDVELTGAGI
jgi:hypothetical protein